MTEKEFAKIAAALGSAYGEKKYIQSKQDADLWYAMLKDLDYTDCLVAVQTIIATSRWHPTISEIRERAAEVRKEPALDWSEAWGAVQYVIHRYGMYRQEEALEALDDRTSRCVRLLGYQTLCTSGNPEADRANFRTMYQAMDVRDKQDAQIPQAVKRAVIGRREAAQIEETKKLEGKE